jgi:hypothetical protein
MKSRRAEEHASPSGWQQGRTPFLLERPCANSYYRVLLHQLRVVEHEFLETVKLSGSDGVGIS